MSKAEELAIEMLLLTNLSNTGRGPAVIWPIAEHFDCFPYKSATVSWIGYVPCPEGCVQDIIVADTAAKAVAFAVIKAKEKQDTMIPIEPIKTPLQGVF